MFKTGRLLIVLLILAVWMPKSSTSAQASTPPPPAMSFPPSSMDAAGSPQALGTGPMWYDGAVVYSTIVNCPSIISGYPYSENGVGTFVGFYANESAAQLEPYPFETYYVRIYVASLGYPCSGPRLGMEISLPPNTSLAIDATNKVYCYYDHVSDPTDCPQNLPQSTINLGSYSIPSADSAHAYTWPLPQGHNLEIQIPVKSSAPMTNVAFHANVLSMDGNSSPWLYPQQGVFVFTHPPLIANPIPSTDSITATSAKSYANLTAYGLTGPGYFDLGTDTSYSLWNDPFNITASQEAPWAITTDWTPFTLQPNTTYHWRIRFFGSNGVTYYGTDQTFTTLAEPSKPPTLTFTPTPTQTPTKTATPTQTSTSTATQTLTSTPTKTATSTQTATRTPTQTATATQNVPTNKTATATQTATRSAPPAGATWTPTSTLPMPFPPPTQLNQVYLPILLK